MKAGARPWPGRSPVQARNLVASSHPLASAAGVQALRSGGNAIDAALAAAITLTVVEPTGNGVGGDLFAQVWDGQTLHGLNGSGRSPCAWSPERFAGRTAMPSRGWDSVTVPGAVAAWVELSERFGQLPFADLFRDAIGHARDGFGIGPHVAHWWRHYAPESAPPEGFWQRSPELAASLTQIAASRGAAFYTGALAEASVAASQAAGGAHTLEDFAAHRSLWVSPLSVPFAGAEVWALPPNSQGIVALLALGLLQSWPGVGDGDPAAVQHRLIEAVRAALAIAQRELADPAAMTLTPQALLDPMRLKAIAARLDPDCAARYAPEPQPTGGTVYLCAADAEGRLVSLIQSNYQGFGARVEVPGTGLSFNNRGACFTLIPGHPNQVGPTKLPFHTLTPGFLTRGGQPLAAFGVMGGALQPQAQVQLLHRLLVDGEAVQSAIDAPRWEVSTDGLLRLEPGFDAAVMKGLEARGHRLERLAEPRLGGGQLIWHQGESYLGASDHRKDGQACGY